MTPPPATLHAPPATPAGEPPAARTPPPPAPGAPEHSGHHGRDRAAVVALLRRHGPLSRSELGARLGAGRFVMRHLSARLLAEGVVEEGGLGNSAAGRPARLLCLPARERFTVGVDLGGHTVSVAAVRLDGEPGGAAGFALPAGPEALVARVAEHVEGLLARHGRDRCAGLGMVAPGAVLRTTGELPGAAGPAWRGFPLAEALARATGLPVHAESAPAACALAAALLPGGAAGAPLDGSVLFVSVSGSVETAMLLGGRLLAGRAALAAGFGHMPLSLEGPACACGRTGCLEAYTASYATLARLRADPARPATMDEVVARARRGDARAREALRESAGYLGAGLAGLVTALAPSRVVVTGELAAAWVLVEEALRRRFVERCLLPGAAATPITPLPAGPAARLRATAALFVGAEPRPSPG